MAKIVTVPLPHDLPENWKENQVVSPGGTEVGLSEQYGFNYLMKQVNNAQKAALELDERLAESVIVGENLLHNWYFKSPIDTKAGEIVPAGVDYFSDKALNTKVGSLPSPEQVVAVLESSIQIKMNNYYTQYTPKGNTQPGYVGSTAGKVSVDRWFLKSKGTGQYNNPSEVSHCVKGANGLALTLSKVNGAFYQNVANVTSADKFGGHTFTLSVKVESLSGGTSEMYINDGVQEVKVALTKTGITTVTATLDASPTAFTVGIRNVHATDLCNMQVSAGKLEVGTVSTLHLDAPADRATQMAQCIQFDPTTDAYRGFTVLTTTNILANASVTE